MNKRVLAIPAAAIAMYLWGFLFWGVSTTVPYMAWKSTGDDSAAQQVLKQTFPESGTYYIPSFDNPPEQLAQMFEAGPVGFVHINLEGRSQMDPSIMIFGFLVNVVVCALLAGLFRVTGAREFRDFVWTTMTAAALAVVMIDIGDAAWWQTPVGWKLTQAFYNFTALLVAGHVMGALLKQEAATT